MKLVSWNVNGIRSLKNSIEVVLEDLEADILCLQEVKANRSTLEDSIINVPGYSSYFSFPKLRSGYSGVATFCRNSARPGCAEEGLSGEFIPEANREDAVGSWPSHPDISFEELKALESEGRALITKHTVKFNTEVKDIAVINVYCPRVDCLKPERAKFQLDFFKLLQRRSEELHKGGFGVFVVGDINTCRHPVDSCDPGDINEFSMRPSRQWLNQFLQPVDETTNESYFIDTFRHFYPEKKNAYTCWMTVTGARKTNYGTRIDYILADKDTIQYVKDSLIMSDVEGSDHCPVAVVVNCQVVCAEKCPSLCSKYWPEFWGQQKKLTSFLRTKKLDVPVAAKRQRNDVKAKQLSITSFCRLRSVPKTDETFQESPATDSCESAGSTPEGNKECTNSEELFSKTRSTIEEQCTGESDKSSKHSQVSAWKNMLSGPPKPPKCSGHQEACLLRTVQKEGPNYGKQFFVCPRPIGDKGNKDARCDYFKWATDAKPKHNQKKAFFINK